MMGIKLIVSIFCLAGFVIGDEYHDFVRTKEPKTETNEDKYFWYTKGQNELNEALQNALNLNVARNVILFIGDGMGIPTISAARIHLGQFGNGTGEEQVLSFEEFPNIGLAKTYNVDAQVPDSAGTATAFLSGVKANSGVVGLDARVTSGECEAMNNETIVDSILQWSQDAGKFTGVVTSTRITHATPACAYAHSPDRGWECDADIRDTVLESCPFLKDIALQLVEDKPGNGLNVIMGGGFQVLDGEAVDLPGDPLSGCQREDGRKLWQEWLNQKASNGQSAAFVRNRTEMLEVNTATTDYLMGIYANSHLPYEFEKQVVGDFPTLPEMTEVALEILTRGPQGFFLLVESGRIDHAHHDTSARASIEEAIYLHQAVQVARNMTSEQDTLIIVTADHSHTMSFGGWPDRGNPILGLGGFSTDLKFYTTLSYANGPGYNYTAVNGTVQRHDPTLSDTEAYNYQQLAAVPLPSETHGGEDVAIYAIGPMSHLLHSVHEQNYIAHAMAYASCVGSNLGHCSSRTK